MSSSRSPAKSLRSSSKHRCDSSNAGLSSSARRTSAEGWCSRSEISSPLADGARSRSLATSSIFHHCQFSGAPCRAAAPGVRARGTQPFRRGSCRLGPRRLRRPESQKLHSSALLPAPRLRARTAASAAIRNGLDGPERPRDNTRPASSIKTHSVFVPPPSNPKTQRIPQA